MFFVLCFQGEILIGGVLKFLFLQEIQIKGFQAPDFFFFFALLQWQLPARPTGCAIPSQAARFSIQTLAEDRVCVVAQQARTF